MASRETLYTSSTRSAIVPRLFRVCFDRNGAFRSYCC